MKTEDPLRCFKALMIWIPIGIILWFIILICIL